MAVLGLGGLGALLLSGVCLLSGCSSVGYLAGSARGHFDLLSRARPVPQWLDDVATPPALRERLALAQRMRDFAVRELKLPDNASYRSYADLQRGAAVWNVVATPELSLTLQTWCFPVVGCVGYRGYFDRPGADAQALELRGQGLEVFVYGVPAYSTLGWMNWLGGDPLLNTFINWPEGELARLLFHELTHQVAYAANDTAFNESLATTVERLGIARWLASEAGPQARADYAQLDARRNDFRALTRRTRDALDALYRSEQPVEAKRAAKAVLFARLRDEHQRLKQQWGGYDGYDGWFARANNAALALQAAYDGWVPALERLFEREGRDFPRFYAQARRLAALPRAEREAFLRSL